MEVHHWGSVLGLSLTLVLSEPPFLCFLEATMSASSAEYTDCHAVLPPSRPADGD